MLNIKMKILTKLLYRFNSIPSKIPAGFFAEIDKMILKFTWRSRDPEDPK